jgi:phosphopantothenoylcysteine decarboxylase / phosphopantothenate---cysteine ligase
MTEPASTVLTSPSTSPPSPPLDLAGRHIVLALTGGIACYKAAELCRALIKQGATVQVVMTEGAQQFITPVTLQALSGRPVLTSQWDAAQPNNMAHINLTRGLSGDPAWPRADALLIAPASADVMAKLAWGMADDLLTVMCLARPRGGYSDVPEVPLLLAPAMNREMWLHPATQRNLQRLADDGAHLLGVGSGFQACGETGDGRMLEPEQIVEDLVAFFQPKLLAGKRVLITAGPTYEAIDPVRGITNRSSGKMGFALARAAREAGAVVTLVAGPVALATPRGVQRVNVQSAREMLAAVQAAADGSDVFIATAAVADWRPAASAEQKIKKDGAGAAPAIAMTENPDILATVAASPRAKLAAQRGGAAPGGALYCVGFAAESHDLQAHAQAKRARKGVPLLVGNIGPATFGQDTNALMLVRESGVTQWPADTKLALARRLVAEIAAEINKKT